MKNFYLTATIILFVIILVVSFQNWISTQFSFFFYNGSFMLTMPFFLIAFIGIACGFTFAQYIRKVNEDNDNDDIDDKLDNDDF